ncbi:MAG: hypothetical protein AAGH99_03030 [Planctomycetota bacterium]
MLDVDDPELKLRGVSTSNTSIVWAGFADHGDRIAIEPSPRMRTGGLAVSALIAAMCAVFIWIFWRFFPEMRWAPVAIGLVVVSVNVFVSLWAYPRERRRGAWLELDQSTQELYGRDLSGRWPLDQVEELVLLTAWDVRGTHKYKFNEIVLVVEGEIYLVFTATQNLKRLTRRFAEAANLPYRRVSLKKAGNHVEEEFKSKQLRY